MPRRVNNLFKIHKAKLVPSVRLGALVELHQRWIWLRCALRQPQRHAPEPAGADLACAQDEIPPIGKTEHTTEQKRGGKNTPTTQGQDNRPFPLLCCAELRVVFYVALINECSKARCNVFILIFTTPCRVAGPPESHFSAGGWVESTLFCHYR